MNFGLLRVVILRRGVNNKEVTGSCGGVMQQCKTNVTNAMRYRISHGQLRIQKNDIYIILYIIEV